jgi:urease accessory protein
MDTEAALYRLLAWTSPSYPTGAFSYSHGLEWAVEAGQVRNVQGVVDYVGAVLTRGGGWVDAVLFARAHEAASDADAFDEIVELAWAFRGSSETALEARQQGRAFLQVTCKAWPHPGLDAFAARPAGSLATQCTALALACSAHGVPLMAGLQAFLHATAANLVSAGLRLVPLGQTDGQIALARLAPVVAHTAVRAARCALDDLGTQAPGLELCSMRHETQYTRLFRS